VAFYSDLDLGLGLGLGLGLHMHVGICTEKAFVHHIQDLGVG
jgi:hypothetical protein